MGALILYYSFTGHTKKLAEQAAKREAADTFELRETRRRTKVGAYTKGCFQTLRMKPSKIIKPETELSGYERFIVMSPVWAGQMPPAVLAGLALLPAGAKIELRMVSASGGSSRENVTRYLEERGFSLSGYEDIKV